MFKNKQKKRPFFLKKELFLFFELKRLQIKRFLGHHADLHNFEIKETL